MKKLIVLTALIAATCQANAQVSSSASQTTRLNLSDAIEITFTGTGNATGSDVNMNFSTVNDYANGVTSGDQEMVVRSNKNFSVSVKANSSQFTYTGSASPAPHMSVASVLNIKVSANGTGGSVRNPFSTTSFTNVNPGDRTIISNGTRGGNQTFSIKYMADPGFDFPAGTYTTDVVFTATQM
ncbi:MAG: hypothetical protein JST70_18840 [Bacteroidetes bacterium]|nr:hypothetical protein [Bacteroidota bacterium]